MDKVHAKAWRKVRTQKAGVQEKTRHRLCKSLYSFVDSPASVFLFVDSLKDLPAEPPSLYIDLEGENLCREGSISLLVVFPKNHVYLIDMHNLQASAFTTAGREGKTLKSILEPATISKVFFDVRNNSDALIIFPLRHYPA